MMGEVAIFGEQPLGQAACRRNVGGITRRQGVDFDAFCFIRWCASERGPGRFHFLETSECIFENGGCCQREGITPSGLS